MKPVNSRDYVAVVYNEQERPFTTYPDQLARYLVSRYGIDPGHRLLDIGCGRGEFLRGFMDCGLQGYGVDRSRAAAQLCPEAELRTTDLESAPLPFNDDSFDIVFSKSVIEHFYFPERLIQEDYTLHVVLATRHSIDPRLRERKVRAFPSATYPLETSLAGSYSRVNEIVGPSLSQTTHKVRQIFQGDHAACFEQ
jgi:SAM-dependent methyltransferase